MKLYIKYMVSLRCKLMVKSELEKLGIHESKIELGLIEIKEDITDELKQQLKTNLAVSGLELLSNEKSILVDRIKTLIIEMIHYSDTLPKVNFSDYISDTLSYDYGYLSGLFTEVKGITIQQFIILHKIERAKELILYDELNLTEIAFILHFSSVAHLSSQFKKVTGQSPSFYKKIGQKRKDNLENLGQMETSN